MSFVAILLGACACQSPRDPQPPMETPIVNTPSTSGADVVAPTEDQELDTPPPPSATLRAPADDRREEVDSQSGIPPAN